MMIGEEILFPLLCRVCQCSLLIGNGHQGISMKKKRIAVEDLCHHGPAGHIRRIPNFVVLGIISTDDDFIY